jgi:sporulation protein YlmC with PRC-barrel domain
MGEVKALPVTKQLKGMPAFSSAANLLGLVTDAIVQPTEGYLLGLLLQTPQGEERAVPADVCFIFACADLITTSEFALVEPKELHHEMPGGVGVCGTLIGTNVVTETGNLLGSVNEVLLLPETGQIVYHVVDSTLQRLFGGGFFLAGDVPCFYSQFGARFIVPAETQARYAAKQLNQAIRSGAVQRAPQDRHSKSTSHLSAAQAETAGRLTHLFNLKNHK